MTWHASQAVFLLGLLTYLVVRAVFQRKFGGAGAKERRSTPRDRLLIALVVAGQIVIPMLSIFSPWLVAYDYQMPFALMPLGGLAEIAGLWLFWRSHHDLGRNWSVTLEVRAEHRLVTQGVYAWVRHPMYASFLLMAAAQALLLPNGLAGGFALAAVALLCLVRVPREEAMMCEFFGEAYRQYRRSTGSVVPRFGLPA